MPRMSGPRRRRALLWIWLGLFVLLVVGIAILRMGRHKFDAPEPVRGSVMRVHGQVSDFYGAKTPDGRVLLFDAGADPEGRGLDALLAALKATREDVSDIFLTHGHGDHVAAAPLCPRARVHGGIGDSDMMSKRGPVVPQFARFMGLVLPVPVVMLTDAFLGATEVPVGGGKSVIAVPFAGHTPGSMLYLYDGVLFAGDSMNAEKDKLTTAFAPFSVDTKLNRKNIAALSTLLKLDDVKVVCTGHGGCTPEADTKRMLDDIMAKAKS
jgi:glyoxylase-like metal-dependent hydrolase (beta-lactamase superfamily II)